MIDFKIGDRVRATKKCSGSIIGEVYELIECDYSSSSRLMLKGTSCSCTHGWELVTPETEYKFKVGDKVRCIETTSQTEIGNIGEVIELRDDRQKDSMVIKFQTKEVWVFNRFFELVKEKEPDLDFAKELLEEDFENTKVRISNKEECREVQRAMFARGFTWFGEKTIKYENASHLYFDESKRLGFTESCSETFFNNYSHREVTINQILKGGNENKKMERRILYHVTIIDRRTSEVVTDENVAAVNEYAAVLKAINDDYDEADVDFFHYRVSSVTEFDAIEPSDKKK